MTTTTTTTLAEARQHSRQWERANSRTEAGYLADIIGGPDDEALYFTLTRFEATLALCRQLANRHGRTVHVYRWEGDRWSDVVSMHPPEHRLTCHVRADALAGRA